jgi:hypothetical protein
MSRLVATDRHKPLTTRAYIPLYSAGYICPGCGGRHWIIGRLLAECGRCAFALPLAEPVRACCDGTRDG